MNLRARAKKIRPHTRAQAFVEFAIIVPILLLVLTAIIEFGYAFYTWAAIGEVARIGARYAVTGQYDPGYCPDAAAALTSSNPSWTNLAAEDSADGAADCVIQSNVTDFEIKTAALQDWARMPSTRDAAMNGAAVGLLFNPDVSGDYIQFLSHPAERGSFTDSDRGNPTADGYISVNICSNRFGVGFDPTSRYYNDLTDLNDAKYLGVCLVNNYYLDDAGGPGDRIRLTVTYNHPLIIPFFQALWPHLKLSTTQDAIVEKFRTSRLAGLSGGISVLSTWTPTPGPTDTPTETSIPPTDTPTPTLTPSPTLTPTPLPCNVPPNGNGLLAHFYAYYGSPNSSPFANLVYVRTDPVVNFDWGNNSPQAGSVPVDNFRGRWTGQVYPPYPGDYQFFTWSDDGVRLYLDDTNLIINNWGDHGSTKNYSATQTLSCGAHNITLEYYENGGGAVIKLGWANGNFTDGEMLPIAQQYLFSPTEPFDPTSTYVTPTPTRTYTPTLTRTPSQTFTPSRTFTPSLTYTRTNTRTTAPTQAATNTSPPTNTLPPTATRTATRTPTPKPTCGISSDAGGCTPIP